MRIEKLLATGISVLLAAAVLLPAQALAAQNQPDVDYGTGAESSSGGNTTQLTLVLQDPDANLASNGGETWVAQHAKVQVPVAINFVVAGDGTITGPDGAEITNYSGYAVNVSNIKVVPASNSVSFAATLNDVDTADEIYLTFQPGEGTPVSLATFATQNGTAPAAGEWNISGSTESNANVLTLTEFSGKIGGFNTINPLSKTEFGHIEWTIKAGTALPTPTISTMTASELTTAGNTIRGGDPAVKAQYEAAIGQTTSVTLGDIYHTPVDIVLVDVSYDKGLVFMFKKTVTTAFMYRNGENTDWENSLYRDALNSGGLYTNGLQFMRVNDTVVVPYQVAHSSMVGVDNGQILTETTTDKYWAPSLSEVYGELPSGATDGLVSSNADEGCTQFKYFQQLGITGSNYTALGSLIDMSEIAILNSSSIWTRSCSGSRYGIVTSSGSPASTSYTDFAGVLVCFAV